MSKLAINVLSSSGAAPRLFECNIDRSQTQMPKDYLPEATVVSIAGEDMLQAAGYVPGSYRPHGWRRGKPDVFTKRSRDGTHTLRVRQGGGRAKDKEKLWAIERIAVEEISHTEVEALTFVFVNVPIWTRTYQGAMRLAEYCDPSPRPPVPGWWVKTYKV